MDFIRDFFSSKDVNKYPPCGLFSLSHIISLIICIVIIGLFVYLKRKKSKEQIIKSTRVMAIIVTSLEFVKIFHSFYYGYTYLDSWFPLAYCSFLIYCLYFVGYGKGNLQKCGLVFLSGPAFIAGLGFLIFPTTSLADYPIFHYLCFYSLFFHSVMVYYAIMIYRTKAIDYKLTNTKYYLFLLYCFSIVAIAMDYIFECNMMFYYNPYNFPFQFVIDIYNISRILYTCVILLAYSMMYFIVLLIVSIINRFSGGKY